MKMIAFVAPFVLLAGTVASVPAYSQSHETLIVTASNTVANNLLVYDSSDHLIQTLSTEGKGGVGGNSGGIAASQDRVAVVNFGSDNVSVFVRSRRGFRLNQVISTEAGPLSVAFGHNHLYILSAKKIESHEIFDFGVSPGADGVSDLLTADGSAAQVGVLNNQLIVSEKSGAIETLNLRQDGSVEGLASLVRNIPQNVDTPFGLTTRDNQAYVSIAHANEISLVRNDAVITTTGSGTQSAPCWLALDGPYLFSANSPSKSVSRYVVHGKQIVQEAAVAASFAGNPTDIAYSAGYAAVIDHSGTVSHLSIFSVDGDGVLSLRGIATISSVANGVAVVRDGD